MFTVTGTYADQPFDFTWNDDGTFDGDLTIRSDLERDIGAVTQLPPTGPVYTVDNEDPLSVIAWLYANASPKDWTGEVPAITDDLPEDAVA